MNARNQPECTIVLFSFSAQGEILFQAMTIQKSGNNFLIDDVTRNLNMAAISCIDWSEFHCHHLPFSIEHGRVFNIRSCARR